MDNMQKIEEYIAKTEIKSCLFGGYNKTDVHNLLKTVIGMFETTLKEQQEKNEQRTAELLAEVDAAKEAAEENAKMADVLIVDLNKTIVSLTEHIEESEEKMGNVQKALSDLLEMMNE